MESVETTQAERVAQASPRCRRARTAPALWANRNFLLLWSGQFVSQMGDRLYYIAFPWLVYGATDSALSTGIALALYTLPYLLFGMFAGVIIDRFDKRRVMLAAEILRTAIVLLVPVAAAYALWSVFVLSFAVASLTVIFDPAKLSLLPDLVTERQLMRANSFLASAETLTEVLGYAGAGFLLATVSTTTAFRVDAVTFFVSAVTLVLMSYRRPTRAAERAARSFSRELREGFAYIRHHTGLLANTMLAVFIALGLGAALPLTFFLAVTVLGNGDQTGELDFGIASFGIFEAAIAVGYLTGSLVVAGLAGRLRVGRAIIAGFAVTGAGMAAVAAANRVWIAAVIFAVIGAANAGGLIAIDTYVQRVVPEHVRGRVWGSRFMLTQGAYAVSVLAAGALLNLVGPRTLFVVAGLVVAVPALVAVFVPTLRDA